jgi:acylphosphatase
MKRVHLIISGSVQGVFFRDFVREIADRLGLTGFVKNLENSVEVVAEGKEKDLLKLIESCKIGPSSARVSNVNVEWFESTGKFEKFFLKY